MLLGLDNQILTLSHSPGSLASDSSPEGRAQRFLEAHFNEDMSFTSNNVAARSGRLSKRLDDAIASYFAKPTVADEVPSINGDPFTDAQELPTRFTVGTARTSDDRAEVPIRFSDAFSDRAIMYVMRHEHGEWQLDDVRFEDGELLSRLIK